MYFENYKVEQSYWERWKNWSEDITEKSAFVGLDFVREFATVYKNQVETLERDYHSKRKELADAYNTDMIKIKDDHKLRCATLESEKNTVISSVNNENQRINKIMTDIKSLEATNAAAVSIIDYVQLKEQREADLAEFTKLQEERKQIAVSLYQEKIKIENERFENARSERERRHGENLRLLNDDRVVAIDRLEKEYRELFAVTIMSLDSFNAYVKRCNSFRCPLEDYSCRRVTPEYVYTGTLQMFIPKELKTPLVKTLIEERFGVQGGGIDDPFEIRLPYCQKISDGIGLFITDKSDAGLNVAYRQEHKNATFEDELAMSLLRTFMSIPAGKVEAFTIDTGRMGAVFHDILVLGSRHRRIIEPASSRSEDIERTLSTLRSKVDGIANNYGDDFESRMKRESYYALAISNFPEGFTAKALKDLSVIVKNAAACGVAVYILATEARLNNMSGENRIIADEIMQTLQNMNGSAGVLKCVDKYITSDVNVILDGMYDYDKDQIETVMNTLLTGINGYRAVTTTFEDIYPEINDPNTWMSRNTMQGIYIPVGIKGSSDMVNICIGAPGANSEHHVLIEGSTGAGKSTFLHTLIMSTLISYSPLELEMLLVDFKAGIEFKRYADYDIPSLKIVAIQSEREFGLNVFRELERKFQERSEAFKSTGATSTDDYRKMTGNPMPKIVLIMDEYQELFVGNDDITRECERILRTLVLMGRAYGIHIILATQNLNQAQLDQEIYKQMVVRIALKGAKNILSSDNIGTEMLINSNDGTTIYNTNCGESSSNKVFQTAYLGTGEYHCELLSRIGELQRNIVAVNNVGSGMPNKVLFTNIEDNRRHRLNQFILENAIPEPANPKNERIYGLFLGEVYDLEGKLNVGIPNVPEANLFVSVSSQQMPKIMVNSVISLLYGDIACKNATKGNRLIHFVNMVGEGLGCEIKKLERLFPEYIKYAEPENADDDWAIVASGYDKVKEIIDNTYDELCKRRGGNFNPDDRLFLVLAGMEKMDVLAQMNSYEKQTIDEYAIDGAGRATEKNVIEKLVEIIKYGPELSINSIMYASDIEAASMMYGERFYDSFALRIAQQLSDNYMKEIVREYHPESLKPTTMVFCNKGIADNKKFRPYEIPGDDWLRNFADRYHSFSGGNE